MGQAGCLDGEGTWSPSCRRCGQPGRPFRSYVLGGAGGSVELGFEGPQPGHERGSGPGGEARLPGQGACRGRHSITSLQRGSAEASPVPEAEMARPTDDL